MLRFSNLFQQVTVHLVQRASFHVFTPFSIAFLIGFSAFHWLSCCSPFESTQSLLNYFTLTRPIIRWDFVFLFRILRFVVISLNWGEIFLFKILRFSFNILDWGYTFLFRILRFVVISLNWGYIFLFRILRFSINILDWGYIFLFRILLFSINILDWNY